MHSMTFQALDFSPYPTICMVLFIVFMIFTFSTLVFTGKNKKLKFFVGIGYGLSVIALFASFIPLATQTNENKDKATANIMQKYDVKSVEWESSNTTANPMGEVRDGKLLVSDKTDQQYIFQYSINKDSSEPTLKDMPIQGGANIDKAKTANSLLKK